MAASKRLLLAPTSRVSAFLCGCCKREGGHHPERHEDLQVFLERNVQTSFEHFPVQQVPAVDVFGERCESREGCPDLPDDFNWDVPLQGGGIESATAPRRQLDLGKKMASTFEECSAEPLGRSKCRFQALDTLRGVAALAVSALHLERGEYFLQNWNGVYAPAFYLGLDFFVVLSGFVLSHSYMFADDPVMPLKFVRRRLVRLWPMHALAVITTTVARWLNGVLLLVPLSGVLQDFAQELTLLHCVGLPYPHVAYNNMISWTISCELWINVVFAFCICQGVGPSVVIMLLGLALQAWLFFEAGCLDVWSRITAGFISIGLVRCSSCFMLGVVAYAAHRRLRGAKLKVVFATLLEAWLVLAVVVLVCIRPTHCFWSDFAAAPLFATTVVCFARMEGWLSWALTSGHFLGTVSYSIYLNQWTVLLCMKASGLFEWPWLQQSVPLQLVAYWTILVPYSCLTYGIVERTVDLWWKGDVRSIPFLCVGR